MRTFCLLLFLSLMSCLTAETAAQEQPGFQMPTDPSVWLNSPPITSEMLVGKSALLYFFEEG